jgi:hypothetical protein
MRRATSREDGSADRHKAVVLNFGISEAPWTSIWCLLACMYVLLSWRQKKATTFIREVQLPLGIRNPAGPISWLDSDLCKWIFLFGSSNKNVRTTWLFEPCMNKRCGCTNTINSAAQVFVWLERWPSINVSENT